MPSFLTVYMSGASLILLLTAVSEARYEGVTPSPDYDSDYNATFDYSFYSNGSIEDLDKFSERFIEEGEGEDEDSGERHEEEVPVTTVTTLRTTEQGQVDIRSASSLLVSLDMRTLLWTLMILISFNTQHLSRIL